MELIRTSPVDDIQIVALNPTMNEVLESIQTTFKRNRKFQIHASFAILSTLANFLAWLIVDITEMNIQDNEPPWFIFTPVFFLFTLTLHFWRHTRRKDYLLHVHSLLFLGTFMAAVLTRVLWPTRLQESVSGLTISFSTIYLPWGIGLLHHFFKARFGNHAERWIYFHTSCFIFVNGMLLATWTSLESSVFWVVWPFCLLLIPLTVHWNLHFHPNHHIRLHFGIYFSVQLLLLLTWLVGGKGFPWWAFPLIVWTSALWIHFATFRYTPPPSLVAAIPPELTSAAVRSHFRRKIRASKESSDSKVELAMKRSLSATTIPSLPPSAPPLADDEDLTSHSLPSRVMISTLTRSLSPDPSQNRRYIPPDQRELKS